MKLPFTGAIDCDIHPAAPGITDLLPHLDDFWRDQFVNRHIDKLGFHMTSYPPNSPLTARPDWRSPSGEPGGRLDLIRSNALDPFGTRFAICNVLHGAIALFHEDMAAALCAGRRWSSATTPKRSTACIEAGSRNLWRILRS